MGCGASHNDDVIKNVLPKKDNPNDKNIVQNKFNGKDEEILNNAVAVSPNVKSLNSSLGSETSTIPANDFYQNFSLNNTNMSGNLKPLPNTLPPLKPPRTSKVGFLDQNTNESTEVNKNGRAVPVAFEVPVADVEEEVGSLIKKHPPRRLRRMEDQLSETLTQEGLNEKVQQANQRRTQVLHQRVASARQKSARVGTRTRPSIPVLDQNEVEECTQP